MAQYLSDLSKARVLSSSTPEESGGYKFKWIGLRSITWEDPSGKQRIWESADRLTRPQARDDRTVVDGVAIYARLHHPQKPTQVVLVGQFRPPVGKVTIELPAGLMDASDRDASETAVRELLEETGLKGKVMSISPVSYSDPGMTSANMQLVSVDVDLEDPENACPQARLEDGEFVHTFTAEEGKLLEKLHCLREDGYEIDARLYSLAFGMDMGFQRAKLNAPTNITLPDFSGPGWDEYNRSYRRGFVHGFGFGSVGAFLPGLLLGVMCASSFAAYKKFAR